MKAILKYPLYKRPQPTNEIPAHGFLPKDSVIDVEEVVQGKAIDKIAEWYKATDGFYYWGGGVVEKVSSLFKPATSIANKDWWFDFFNIENIWKLSKGEGISVAILDSGLNFDLDDFKNGLDIIFYSAFKDSVDKVSCLDDLFGHGTDCTGVLCGQGTTLLGVAPKIKLHAIKICNDAGERETGLILKGLEKAIEMKVDVISMSFSLAIDENFEAIHKKIINAYNTNITLVAAVGDSGGLSFPVDNFPASFPECISVGGITQNKLRSRASTRSNFLDLMGPGEEMMSAFNPVQKIKGTSFSAPFAAGAIALIKSVLKNRGKSISNVQLYDILKRTAQREKIIGYNEIEYGSGIIDPEKALEILLKL